MSTWVNYVCDDCKEYIEGEGELRNFYVAAEGSTTTTGDKAFDDDCHPDSYGFDKHALHRLAFFLWNHRTCRGVRHVHEETEEFNRIEKDYKRIYGDLNK